MSITVDFHCHTSASKDSYTSPEELIESGHSHGIDRLVVTDHNTIDGALISYLLDPEMIIVGEEIMTTKGEILAAFVTKKVPPGLSPQATINRLRDQRAFISISHPFDYWRNGAWKLTDLIEIAPGVDAIEIFNARCMNPLANREARKFALLHNIPGTAGSDAHAANEIGAAKIISSQFANAEELRKVIHEGKVKGRVSPFWVHIISRYAFLRKKVV